MKKDLKNKNDIYIEDDDGKEKRQFSYKKKNLNILNKMAQKECESMGEILNSIIEKKCSQYSLYLKTNEILNYYPSIMIVVKSIYRKFIGYSFQALCQPSYQMVWKETHFSLTKNIDKNYDFFCNKSERFFDSNNNLVLETTEAIGGVDLWKDLFVKYDLTPDEFTIDKNSLPILNNKNDV